MNPRTLTEVFLILLGVYCIAEGAINFSKGIPILSYGPIGGISFSNSLFYFVPSLVFLVIAMGLLRYARRIATKYFGIDERDIQRGSQTIQNWYVLTFIITGFLSLTWVIPTVFAAMAFHITSPYFDQIGDGRSWQYYYFLREGVGSIQIMIACGLIIGARRLTHFLCKIQALS